MNKPINELLTAKRFQAIRIRIASPERIALWARHPYPNRPETEDFTNTLRSRKKASEQKKEQHVNYVSIVQKADTLNYRSHRPTPGGLFCEHIFGPVYDMECRCGQRSLWRRNDMSLRTFCPTCGVEYTSSIARRYRMSMIELHTPLTHIWFIKGRPSALAAITNIRAIRLERIAYREVDTDINWFLRKDLIGSGERRAPRPIRRVRKGITKKPRPILGYGIDGFLYHTKRYYRWKQESSNLIFGNTNIRVLPHFQQERNRKRKLARLLFFSELRTCWGGIGEMGTGPKAIRYLIDKNFLPYSRYKEERATRSLARMPFTGSQFGMAQLGKKFFLRQKRKLYSKKIKNRFLLTNAHPRWLILSRLPILPPTLRPILQLSGGKFAASDLNDLYRQVVLRSVAFGKMKSLDPPYEALDASRRLLQSSVDALFENGRGQRPVIGPHNRPLKCLSDIIKGKHGRFRWNLLGKRVDYSGRSVIVVGPTLRLHECGIPRLMAIELFYPFIIQKLLHYGYAQTIRRAKQMIANYIPIIWRLVDQIIRNKLIFLNRAPTLHRLSVQAFMPVLVGGKTIRLHPLVCPPFNADFDGDQMAVHVPLTPDSQLEARTILLSTLNLLSPSNGQPVTSPSQDMVLGFYYLTLSHSRCLIRPNHQLMFGNIETAFKWILSTNPLPHINIWVRFQPTRSLAKQQDKLYSIRCSNKGIKRYIYRFSMEETNQFNELSKKFVRITVGRLLFSLYLYNAAVQSRYELIEKIN